MFQQTNHGICFQIKVIPKASRSELVGWENEVLKIRVAAVPEKGAANAEIIRYLAELLEVGKTAIQILQGETSCHKRICVQKMAMEMVQTKIQFHLDKRMKMKKKN